MNRKTSNPDKMTAFLFGAGISKPAGLPLTGEITDFLLKGERIIRHTSGHYLIGDDPQSGVCDRSRDLISRIVLLLQILKTEADLYYFGDRRVNYEDLYFMANQVLGSLTWDEDNPVAGNFAQHLRAKLDHLLLRDPFVDAISERNWHPQEKIRYCDTVSNLTKLMRECCNYVQDIIALLVGRQCHDIGYLSWILDAIADSSLGEKVLFTLNYDILVEKLFLDAHRPLNDGFGEEDSERGVALFDSQRYGRPGPQLIKLHGSLNWFTNRPYRSDGPREPLRIVKPVAQEVAAKHFELANPILLVGTHNKPANYSNYLFEDQHSRFSAVLRKSSRIVVCGYSFSDKAINTRVIIWLDQDRGRRVIVIHPNESACQRFARPAIGGAWEGWKNSEQLVVIPAGAEQVTWQSIREHL